MLGLDFSILFVFLGGLGKFKVSLKVDIFSANLQVFFLSALLRSLQYSTAGAFLTILLAGRYGVPYNTVSCSAVVHRLQTS